jgi:hypothetical protein
MEEKTSVDWFEKELIKRFKRSELHYTDSEWCFDMIKKLSEQAKEMEKYNSKIQAKKYYLKGFEDAELTESQNCSHEQTMRDAETHFELVFEYQIKSE